MEAGETQGKRTEFQVPWIPATPSKPIHPKPAPICTSGEGNGSGVSHPHFNGIFAGSEAAGDNWLHRRSAPPAAPATNIADHSAQSRVPMSFDNNSSSGFGLFVCSEPAGANGPNRRSAPPAAPATGIANHNAQSQGHIPFDINSSSGFGFFAGSEPAGANGLHCRSAPPAAPATDIANHNAQGQGHIPFDINSSSGFGFFAGSEPAGANGPNRQSAPPAAPVTNIADHNAQSRVPVPFDINSSSGFGFLAGSEPARANGPNRLSAPPAAPATSIADHNAQSQVPILFDLNSSSGFSFAEFLARVNDPPPPAYSNAAHGGFFGNQFMPTWNWNSQFNQNQAYASIGRRHFPQELPLINTIHGNYQDPQGTPYFLYNTSSQVAPPAPNMANTAESSQVAATQLSMATGLGMEVRDQGGETSVPATENDSNPHNKLYDPDHNKEIGQGIDLNRTPQPKPKRKKHRPKVVREAKPKSTKTPATPKTEKRKNAGKGLKTDSPQAEVTGEGDKLVPEPVKKSCRRPLNFDLVDQPMDGNSAIRENATTHWNREIGVQVKETQVLNSYMSLQGDSQTPSADLSKSNPFGSKPNANYVENGSKRGWMIGQDGCDKLLSAAAAQSRQHDSNGSYSQLLATRLQVVGSKRKQSGNIEHADNSSINLIGTQYNSLQGYLPKFLVEFPNVQKKRRSEKGKIPNASNTFSMTAAANVQPAPCPQEDVRSFTQLSSSSCWTYGSEYNPVIVPDMPTATERAIHDKPQSFECNLSLGKRQTKRRSRVPARINDFSSLTFFRNYDSKLTRTVQQGSSDRQTCEDAERPQTCMDALTAGMSALFTKKKRSKKRSTLVSSADPGTSEMQQHHTFAAKNHSWAFQNSLDVSCEGRRNNIHTGGTLTERSGDQNLYREDRAVVVYGQNAVVPYKQQNRNYKSQGTMIPYSPTPIKKQRPKVDLDEETNKVWKLLMLDINSHGVDGTDEEKAKWWEEERNVFRGRADSFIARMHLVQGDRRFSKWKGSVVDSVVGVFLTQNVSDHLSSSAFMSLAARFPLKPSSNCETHNKENTSFIVNEPQVHMAEAEENGKLKEKILNLSACELSSMTVDVFEHSDEREVADSNDSCRNSSSITLTDESNCKLLESAQRHTREHSPMESVCPMTGEVQENSCNGGVRRECNDLFSTQGSFITSQISGDFSIDQNPEKISSDCNSEVEDLSSTAKYNIYHNRTSFSKLLEMAGSTMLHEVNSQRSKSNESLRDAYGQSVAMNHDNLAENLEKTNITQDFLEASTISSNEYTLKVTPDSGVLDINYPNPLQVEASSSGSSKNTDEINKRSSFPTTESESQAAVAHSESMLSQLHLQPQSDTNKIDSVPVKSRGKERKKEKKNNFDWDSLRIQAQATAGKREKTENTMDSLDWEAVRRADVNEIADAIKERGMHHMLAERIQSFLNLLVDVHGAIDLEWLRDVPPDQAKEFLLSIRGLGLKSVECVRLLTLHQLAFPVDTNVGRIAVRLGWVPLQPLPESLQLHLLELYPVLESIQKYLWPRLCKLDQKTLYELHYQLITFGKVFCTKSNPNCNSCPMRGECRHFASAFASARLALPGPEQKSIVVTTGNNAAYQNPSPTIKQLPLALPENTSQPEDLQQTEVTGQLAVKSETYTCQPIIEEPASPEPEDSHVSDIEDAFYEESDEIPTIKLNMEEFASNLQNIMQNKMELQKGDMSKALVALHPEATFIPTPKLKNVSWLRTEHSVYELPDSHPLLEGWEKREPDDPGKYLLAIWTPGETADSIEKPEGKCIAQDFAQLCDDRQCFSCNSFREANSQIVRGTILIPCRTAMRGSFPLNGTYFQVNEVFADHDSSHEPISVPRDWIWNLPRRTVYFGTSISSIFKGLTTPEIQQCFWRGFVCVRGFERGTRAPRPLKARLHFPVSKLPKNKDKTKDKTKNESASANSQGMESNPEQPANLQGVNPNPEQPELLSNIPHFQGNGGV